MNKLGEMFDSVAEITYELASINIKILKQLIIKGMKTPESDVIRFDSESEYIRPDYQGARRIKEKNTTRVRHAQFGVEHTSFIVSYDSSENVYRILDGFNRLFGHYGDLDQDVLVKIYKDITPRDWINIMVHSNAWKISGGGTTFFMDRGFSLSLYEHYGVDLAFSPKIEPENTNMFVYSEAVRDYLGSHNDVYDTLLNNSQFVDDIALIKELLLTQLSYRKTVKNQETVVLASSDDFTRYNQVRHHMELIKKYTLEAIGEIRRTELRNGLEPKTISSELLFSLFDRDELQAHFVKVTEMKVRGFADNYMVKHLKEPIYEHFMKGLGYSSVKTDNKSADVQFEITPDML